MLKTLILNCLLIGQLDAFITSSFQKVLGSSQPSCRNDVLSARSSRDENAPFERKTKELSRRQILAGALTASQIVTSPALAADSGSVISNLMSPQAGSTELETGLLESRVVENILNPPTYGMEGSDVFYPSWFAGNWKVRSKTRDVQAPCGVAFFGGNNTFNKAKNDVGNVLLYECRFVKDASDRTIADREYNVKSIVKVAMGENSVVDVALATPNKFSCLLAPKGSPSMLTVDLIVLNRREEHISTNKFDCSEVVREIASPVDKPRQQQAILKEIETTSLYTYDPDKDEVQCQQRSAAFLMPSNDNVMAMQMWQASRGRAIDVRFYDVTYTRS